MANVTITVDTSKAVAALAALSGPGMAMKLNAGLRELALFGERQVAAKTPVKTGAARASIKASQMGPLAWKIGSANPVVSILEGGSRAHTITPRGRFLRFQVGGTVVFARRVRHPGTRAYRMFAQAAPQIQAQAGNIFARIAQP